MAAAVLTGASEKHPTDKDVDDHGDEAAHPQPGRENFMLTAPGEPPKGQAADQQCLEHGQSPKKDAGGNSGGSGHITRAYVARPTHASAAEKMNAFDPDIGGPVLNGYSDPAMAERIVLFVGRQRDNTPQPVNVRGATPEQRCASTLH